MKIQEKSSKRDLYLPIWVLLLGVLLICAAVCIFVVLVLQGAASPYSKAGYAAAAVGLLVLGTAAILCHKNQGIRMVSDSSFEYSTMFGKKTVYSFSQIAERRQNADSVTLILTGGEKIHMESCAIVSDRLMNKINRQLSKAGE